MSPWVPILVLGGAIAYVERKWLQYGYSMIAENIQKGLGPAPAAQAGNPISTAASANALIAAYKPVSK